MHSTVRHKASALHSEAAGGGRGGGGAMCGMGAPGYNEPSVPVPLSHSNAGTIGSVTTQWRTHAEKPMPFRPSVLRRAHGLVRVLVLGGQRRHEATRLPHFGAEVRAIAGAARGGGLVQQEYLIGIGPMDLDVLGPWALCAAGHAVPHLQTAS